MNNDILSYDYYIIYIVLNQRRLESRMLNYFQNFLAGKGYAFMLAQWVQAVFIFLPQLYHFCLAARISWRQSAQSLH